MKSYEIRLTFTKITDTNPKDRIGKEHGDNDKKLFIGCSNKEIQTTVD